LSWNNIIFIPVKSDETDTEIPKAIYGNDDRLDIYQIADLNVLDAYDSTCVIVPEGALIDNGTTSTFFYFNNATLNEAIVDSGMPALCADEPYRNQPVPGRCSAFLVAPDIVATAGHCIQNASQCDEFVYIFGFQMEDASTPRETFPNSEIYHCVEIVDRAFTEGDDSAADWALIRLDRPVTGHTPLPIRRSGSVSLGQEVMMIGYPRGLPAKVVGGAGVRNIDNPNYFKTNLDSYRNNSGSAVFDAAQLYVEGVLAAGDDDFVTVGGCTRSRKCPDDGCNGADVTRTTLFDDLVPVQTTYHVNFGTPGNLQMVGIVGDRDWHLPPLAPNTTYHWQIERRNACGTALGPEWAFTTGSAPTPTPTHDTAATFDSDGSNEIDAKDLLNLIENGPEQGETFFDFARFWKTTP
jgi:hypothetical protein